MAELTRNFEVNHEAKIIAGRLNVEMTIAFPDAEESKINHTRFIQNYNAPDPSSMHVLQYNPIYEAALVEALKITYTGIRDSFKEGTTWCTFEYFLIEYAMKVEAKHGG